MSDSDPTISHGLPESIVPLGNAPQFPLAAQPEIIRAHQKDLYYLHELRELLEPVLRNTLGTRWLHRWTEEVTLSSRVLYFSLTTFIGSQTLGEEYTDVFHYIKSTRRLPTLRRRMILLALHILAPYALQRIYTRMRNRGRELRQHAVQAAQYDFTPLPLPLHLRILSAYEWPDFQSLVEETVRPVHLAIFYLTGKYYSVAKRFTKTIYLSSQPPPQSEPPSYEVLGAMMAIQIIIRTFMALNKSRSDARQIAEKQQQSLQEVKQEKETIKKKKIVLVDGVPLSEMVFDPENPSVDEDDGFADDYNKEGGLTSHERRCTLCLGPRRSPTSTECGHVFCWECIVGWAREKNECPLCRDAISSLSQLLPVYNL